MSERAARPPLFAWRGVVEGFYGTPWAHEDRAWMIEWLGQHGHNTYVYAPKGDPKHRAQWRERYTADELRQFAELVETGKRSDVTVGIGLSPGLDVVYSSPRELDALAAKLEPLLELGMAMVWLLFDDIAVELRGTDPVFRDDLAGAQAHLANQLLGRFGDVPHFLCPTDYIGTRPTEYLLRLGKELDTAIPIAWTGPEVTSPTIRAEDAETMARDLGRPLAICDNYPVNDGPMRLDLKLGPYPHRDPELARHCAALLLNPMQQCRSSALAVATAGSWCADPDSYDPGRALDEVVQQLAPVPLVAAALGATADACRWSQVERRPAPRFVADADRLLARWQQPDWWTAAAGLAETLKTHVSAHDVLAEHLDDRRLWAELEPWSEQQATGAAVLRDVAGILLATRPDIEGEWRDGQLEGRVLVPWDRGVIRRAAHTLELWQDSFGAHLRVYGARVALAPLVRFGDSGQLVGPDLLFGESAIDAFVLRAMAAVREVQDTWPGGLSAIALTVDHAPVDLGPDGSFAAVVERPATVCITWGQWQTERPVRPGEPVTALDREVAHPGNGDSVDLDALAEGA